MKIYLSLTKMMLCVAVPVCAARCRCATRAPSPPSLVMVEWISYRAYYCYCLAIQPLGTQSQRSGHRSFTVCAMYSRETAHDIITYA
jgi:hypothetical protein